MTLNAYASPTVDVDGYSPPPWRVVLWRQRGWWLAAMVLPLLVLLGQVMPVMDLPSWLWLLAVMAGFAGGAALLTTLLVSLSGVLVVVLSRQTIRDRLVIAAGVAVLLACGLYCVRTSKSWRRAELVRVARESRPLVTALDRYRAEHGQYPCALDDLMPDYLPSLPRTGMVAYPQFMYLPDVHGLEPAPGGYDLRIYCDEGVGFDRFFRWDVPHYPPTSSEGGLEPIEDWVYLHE